MVHPRSRARWLLALLGLLACVAAVALLAGCSTYSLFGGPSGGGGGESHAGGFLGDPGGSLLRLDWWLGLAGGICILVGVFRILSRDLAGGGKAIACGIGLFAVNAIVAIILPGLVWIAAIGTGALAAVWGYRLATGRGTGVRSACRAVCTRLARVFGHATNLGGNQWS